MQAGKAAPGTDEAATGADGAESPDGRLKGNTSPDVDWHDRYLRLAAEFDNFRKRSAREFGDLVRNAERELIAELTDVLDSLGRALEQDHKGESLEEFTKGVALIRDQLWDVLGKRGLERMQTVGTVFDPGAHDALMRVPSDEYDEGFVVQEVSPGYHLGDRVLRHAKVIVSQGKVDQSENARAEKQDE